MDNIEVLLQKFKFKSLGVVLDEPIELENIFTLLGFKTNFDPKSKSSNTLVFLHDKNEFLDFLKNNLEKIEYDSVLWFAYPKKGSGLKTDINRDILMAVGNEYGIDTVTAISINATWSALRFRPTEMVGK